LFGRNAVEYGATYPTDKRPVAVHTKRLE